MSNKHVPAYLPDRTHECAECGCPGSDMAGLGIAWAAVEAALPEGHHIAGIEHRWQTVTLRESADGSKRRTYEFPAGLPAYRAHTYAPSDEMELEGWGNTPDGALLALMKALQTRG